MAADLDIHPASPAELESAHRNVFDIWSKGLPIDEHVRYRLNSPSHSRATWYVGVADGRVVTSLGCYPLDFRLRGTLSKGIAIGSVYTLPEYRGRGYAPRLLAAVEDAERQRGATISVLYSDIDPNYYAALGYTRCPSLRGWRELDASEALPQTSLRLVPIDPQNRLTDLMAQYAQYHSVAPLSVERNEEYWRAMLKKFGDDRFFELVDDTCKPRGYVRVGSKENDRRITDYAFTDQSTQLAEQSYTALVRWAAEQGARRVGGWLPPGEAASKIFLVQERKDEITMIKPLVPAVSWDKALIDSVGRFCEIDHV